MRGWAVLAAMVSLLGTIGNDAAIDDDPSPRREPPQASRTGLRVEGDHFLVWDEQAGEARRWGGELARAERTGAAVRTWPVHCGWCGAPCDESTVPGSTGICGDCFRLHFQDDPVDV